MQLYYHYQRRTTFYTHDAYTKYLRSLDMLMSIEIDKSRYKSIASPENFVIIDFYRQIKLINRQLSSTIDLPTSFLLRPDKRRIKTLNSEMLKMNTPAS